MLSTVVVLAYLSIFTATPPAAELSSPYEFEIKRGLAIEPILGGVGFHDQGDNSSLTNGVRAYLFRPDQTDAYVTIEGEWLSQFIFSGRNRKTPRMKWMATANIAFYEIYHPWAGRIALGVGAQRRGDEVTPQSSFRIGAGYYFGRRFSLFVDYASRVIYREKTRSYPGEVTTSAQIIF